MAAAAGCRLDPFRKNQSLADVYLPRLHLLSPQEEANVHLKVRYLFTLCCGVVWPTVCCDFYASQPHAAAFGERTERCATNWPHKGIQILQIKLGIRLAAGELLCGTLVPVPLPVPVPQVVDLLVPQQFAVQNRVCWATVCLQLLVQLCESVSIPVITSHITQPVIQVCNCFKSAMACLPHVPMSLWTRLSSPSGLP